MPSPQRISLFSILLVSSLNGAASWTSTAGHQRPTHSLRHLHVLKVAADSSRAAASTEEASGGDDFSSFAASLEQDAMQRKSSSTTPTRRGSTSANTARSSSTTNKNTWQADLERLLDPSTSPSQRQILLSDLLNANADIRASVQAAIRDRKIDPLLTPTGKKLQDGTRAVARQLTSDIIPSLTRPIVAAAVGSSSKSTTSSSSSLPFPVPPLPLLPINPQDFSRVSNRVLNAVSNQLQRNLETLQSDIANPTRIPERLAKQTEDFLAEAANVFAEKPAGLQEPSYTVVAECVDYEIRDYEAYTVATTNMELESINAVADQGVAFNTLASYIFGANAENRAMEMTTPVTTTASGEMRFYVADIAPPQPLPQDTRSRPKGSTEPMVYDYDLSKIRIERIPAARLAVRRFTGFCTAGEIARQKEALLAALALDADTVELDVPHGQLVGHVVFQYNPPYTLPVLRLNEIAVPVVVPSDDINDAPASAAAAVAWDQELAVNGVSP